MSTVTVPSVLDPVDPVDPVHGDPSKADILRGIVAEKLTTAAREILAAVERTVTGYEAEAAALRRQLIRQRRQLERLLRPHGAPCSIDGDDSPSTDVSGHAEEDEAEDEESAEVLVQSAGPDQDQSDPVHHIQHASGPSEVKDRRRPLDLRVCLLEDTDTLRQDVFKFPIQVLSCPRGLQEPGFLDLLRSTFSQLTEHFEVFTADETRTLTPLKLQTLTPEEIRKSIRSTRRSTLYVRAKRAEELPATSTEQLHPPQRNNKDADGLHTSSDSNKDDHLSSNSTWQQQIETDEEQQRTSDEDDDWKPDRDDEVPRESEAERDPSKVTRRLSSPKAAACNRDARPSCKVCHALRGSTNMLVKHAWSHVDDPERLCGVCGERSESSEELRSHLQGHQKTHICNVCGKSFLSATGLRRHDVTHTGNRPYRCEVCQKTFTCRSHLKAHQWEHAEDRPHKCDVCAQSFGFKQQLRNHSRIHTGEKPYRCDVCAKTFGDLRSLSQHKLRHVGEKRYACPVCGKRFLTPGKVKEHEKIHTDRDRTFLCDVCCKTFHTRGQLKTHLKTHSGDKITCGQCGKALSSEGALRRHVMIHTGERPYECSECGRSFNTWSILQNHLKTHSDLRPFVCSVCGKAYARKEYLSVHMRVHSGQRPYHCPLCDKDFTQSHCLKTHMKTHQRLED
ncbi:zinc finger protein 774 isoform X2 [Larimichthys crocea]|uniref:zinc finger protein 774 isoform X2 n=1 Tax=Larimichthys crocea TaxID=215358 RepID=UPI000F5E4192|nr:zinc finger protein 774 isoform X2 [Larimichthys crocea]